jgi:predicted unusual protein kinase regulating ubiquinone biosynthesis (AarF/ABC1/UbiB family)
MGLALKTEHLKRYRDIARLFWKYGRSDLVGQAELEDALGEAADPAGTAGPQLADEFARDLEVLGPTFVKLGQLLSTRPDLLPAPYLESLARLQDQVAPFPFEQVEAIVREELGVRLSKAFSAFAVEPVAAASLGQVHRAALRDGRTVAVKVQRPGIRAQVLDDLEALAEIAEASDRHTEAGRRYGFTSLVEEFRKALLDELDYRLEARNLATLRENLKEFDRILVPQAIEDYTTARVLTTEYVHGVKVTQLAPVARTELDGLGLARQLFRAYLKQILVDGFVHADPHPGNVFLTEDDRIALLDLGMVVRIAPAMQERLLRLLLAVSEGRGDEAAGCALAIGRKREQADEEAFRRRAAELVARNQDARLTDIEVGKTVLLMARASGENGIKLPPELTMLGKTLLNLDQVGRTLDPDFDPNAAVREAAADLMQKRMRKSLSPAAIAGSLIEAKQLVEKLPERINRIVETVAANELRLKVDALDEKLLMEGFQKIANRITLGLVLAALIVGASMLMRVESRFRILGYPALAMVFFLAAAGAGMALVVTIFLSDQKARKNREDRV